DRMNLGTLLEGVDVSKLFELTYGNFLVTGDIDIKKIQYDSRKVERGDCFVALRGAGTDGHRFIEPAVERGAKVVILEDDLKLPDAYFMHNHVVKIVVPDSRKALAIISANYFGTPSQKLTMVGVTGTNGKTTTTHLVRSILEASGQKAGLIGTIEYVIGDGTLPASHTTPESLELNDILARMVHAGCQSVSMEVSSHALHQSRVYGIGYRAAVFTNLTQDHLDYHGTMEEYFNAKKILFDSLSANSVAVTNVDDPWGMKMVSSTAARTISYGLGANAAVQALDVRLSLEGSTFIVRTEDGSKSLTSPLVGRFNVYNVLSAYATGIGLGIPHERIVKGITGVRNVRGRFERIVSPKGWTAIIDYAHTPDALEKCLRTIHDVLPKEHRGRIVTVFGAGGDRDRTKRPLMGRIAGELSDVVIVTSDNPRTENPETIIDEILAGIPRGSSVTRTADRKSAIRSALGQAGTGDVVLIAGKGHEEYQVIGKEKTHFSDREEVEAFINA
ncbi:MAG TPA: UDP-N-acetylmuramoyl-L-alanyl-D-glutamate--2,6-diaminopimelate ligase, partial [Bacteroidota bacterium]|nr:UDP-N-acetylmuramoyl-L-alanyl-D-glutamate--2,6-diaminopimelate ligase [Bacteroidota bacterium]